MGMLKAVELEDTKAADRAFSTDSWFRVGAFAVCFWIVIVLVSTINAVLTGYTYQVRNLPLDASLVAYAALLSGVMYLILRRLISLSFWQQLLLAVVLVVCFAPPLDAGFKIIRTIVGVDASPATSLLAFFNRRAVLIGSLFWLAPLALWAAICLVRLHDARTRHRERWLAALQAESHAAQMRALRYQVNPHFLYNTLNSISTLVLDGQNEFADRMIMRLAAFFRAGLAQDALGDVRLADEIALQQQYLEIELVRFADSLRVEIDLDDVGDALVPSFVLQPLVENAIKHGLREHGQVMLLSIRARRAGDDLVIDVADDGRGVDAPGGTGVGLSNIRRRLTSRYGDRCSVEAGPREEGGFRVRLLMPLELAPPASTTLELTRGV